MPIGSIETEAALANFIERHIRERKHSGAHLLDSSVPTDKLNGVIPLNKLDPTIFDQLNVWSLLSTVGPLPVAIPSFTTHGGVLLLIAAGSCYTTVAGGIRADVRIDGVVKIQMKATTNEANSHKALVPGFAVMQPAAGAHSGDIIQVAGTSDATDYFNVALIELPA